MPHPLSRLGELALSSWRTLFRVLVILVVVAALLYLPVALFDVNIHLGPLEITGR